MRWCDTSGPERWASSYLARDPELDRSVAIKTLRDFKMEDAALKTFLERFRNEARAAARLHHPAIVQVYDVGEDPDVGPYLVFEYVPGSTLKKLLQERGPMAAAEAALLAEQIGDAIDVAHREGIIHRDIKPENLLVTDAGQCKLADFGVARLPDAALTQEGQFLGTPCYAAPETLSRADYSTKSDLFSFGALLYETVSGARAFPGDDAVAVAHQVVHDDPPLPSAVAPAGAAIPASVDALLMSALAKDPGARPETASALATGLRRAFSDAGLADTVAASYRGHTPPSKAPSRYGFALVAGGVAAVGIASVVVLRDSDARDDGTPNPIFQTDDAGQVARRRDAAAARRATPEADAGNTADAALDAGVPVGAVGPRGEDPEEQAKFALDRARDAIAAGDYEAARRALEEAQRLDPENDGITELMQRIPTL